MLRWLRQVQQCLSRHRPQQSATGVQRGWSWLEGTAAAPAKVAASTDLQAQLKLQDEAAQALKNQRYRNGALNIETSEIRPVLLNQQIVDVVNEAKKSRHRLDRRFHDRRQWRGGAHAGESFVHSAHCENAGTLGPDCGNWPRSTAASFRPIPIPKR